MGIYEKLYDWQKRLVDKYSSRESFGLFLDMGLGKTPISLAFAEKNKCTKLLIITINSKALEPAEIKDSWLGWVSQSEIKYNSSVKNECNFDINQNDVYVVNYESLFSRSKNKKSKVELTSNIMEFIKSCKDHRVAMIIDESHKMKNLQSNQTIAINKIQTLLYAKARRLYSYLLTGTPFTTGYIDLYSQLKFLGYEATKGDFINDFCIRGNIKGLLGWQQPIVGYKNVKQLFSLIHQFAVTIESSTVVDLPEQIFVNHTQSCSDDFKMFINEKMYADEIYKYIVDNHRKVLPDANTMLLASKHKKVNNLYYRDITSDGEASRYICETAGQFWLRARQLSIGFVGNSEECVWFDYRRLKSLEEFLENNEDNYVLFYNYTPELIELYNVCEKLGYNIDVYCGEVKSLKFYTDYSNQNDAQRLSNRKNIILANFASGSTGLNWQLYNKCIIFSVPLYKDYAQAIKRIHRTGQKKTVFYHMFYQQNWLDNSMIKALQEAKQYNEDMFIADKEFVKQM